MKITLIAFGTSIGGAIIFFILGHNLIQAHLFTVGAGWAIFSMGMAFGLALALAVLYFEILSRNLKQRPADFFLLFKTANRKSPQKKGRLIGRPFPCNLGLHFIFANLLWCVQLCQDYYLQSNRHNHLQHLLFHKYRHQQINFHSVQYLRNSQPHWL